MEVNKKFKPKGSWKDKVYKKQEPRIVDIPDLWTKNMGSGKMVIVTPLLINDLVNKIPEGLVATLSAIRKKFAGDFEVNGTCPLTTGIFLRIVAEAAEEEKNNGGGHITPYWRVIRDDGSLIDKYPGGILRQAEYLKKELFNIQAGKKKNTLMVVDFENRGFAF